MVSQKRNLFPGKGCQMTFLKRAETMADKLDSSDIHISCLLFKPYTHVRSRYDGLVDWGLRRTSSLCFFTMQFLLFTNNLNHLIDLSRMGF